MGACRIDHFMYAVPSLDEGMDWAADVFGVRPVYGGEHLGSGTRNALLSLGETYLEIIAPDPAQSLAGRLGEQFAELSSGGLVTWAVQGSLGQVRTTLQHLGLETLGPNRTERRTEAGELLAWELLFAKAPPYGPRMPFFIDWLDSPHPAGSSPSAGEFGFLSIRTQQAAGLRSIFTALGISASVAEAKGEEPGMKVHIETAGGEVVLETTDETGNLTLR